jgi:hypothetical protein
LENIDASLYSDLSESSTTRFFDCLSMSKSLASVTIYKRKLTLKEFTALCRFVEKSNVIVLFLHFKTSEFDLAPLFHALGKGETLSDFTALIPKDLSLLKIDPSLLVGLVKSPTGLARICIEGSFKITDDEFTEALRDNYSLLTFHCDDWVRVENNRLPENREIHFLAKKREAYHLMHNSRLLSSARPIKDKEYRVPLELIESILICNNTTGKYWRPAQLRTIVRVLSSRESVGKIKNYKLEFSAHSLFYVCQKWELLRT